MNLQAEIAARLIQKGIQKGVTVSSAESCTGGLIAKLLTDVAGSSAVFSGACVTYTNEVKIALLGVDPAVIKEFTAGLNTAAQESIRGTTHAQALFGSELHHLGGIFAVNTERLFAVSVLTCIQSVDSDL